MSDNEVDVSRDVTRAVVAAAVSALPIVSGPLGVVLQELWAPQWQRNTVEFVEQLAHDVEELAIEAEELRLQLEDEGVAEVFYRAGRTAQISSHAATRRRCRAAVLNAARQPEHASLNLRFVRMIDELTPAHFTLLKFLQDPGANEGFSSAVQNIQVGSMVDPTAEAVGYSKEHIQLMHGDLSRLGLGQIPGGMISGKGMLARRTSELGDKLLAFVEHPVAGDV
jgi:hypothetical protein